LIWIMKDIKTGRPGKNTKAVVNMSFGSPIPDS
jgi:hypothetical protein